MEVMEMKIYQVVEVTYIYIDGFGGDYENEEEVDKGYYSTMENAQARLDSLTKSHWNSEYNCCTREYKINEIELDIR